jgi:adenylosuccinate synthase
MKKANVVIGSAYGDEGKGVFTDFYSSKSEESLVIRFNGGAQAGHTVVSPEGRRHVFGHFAANSFLKNSKTVLSEFFVVNPLLFNKERILLSNIGVFPKVFIHSECYVSTPFEMILNQWMEESRGGDRHGSCGVGFGETVEREEVKNVNLRMKDIFSKEFKNKLLSVRENFIQRVYGLGLTYYLEKNSFVREDFFIEKFMLDCISMMEFIEVFSDILPKSENIIFEGAQGLLLDQSFGSFPHVTRSNTGLKNVIHIANKYGIKKLDVTYVTRCYTTRHGAGPIKNVLTEKPYVKIEDKTNIPNKYQGNLRFAHLDLDVLKETISKDISSVNLKKINFNWSLGVTCLDQTEEIIFNENENNKLIKAELFPKYLEDSFNAKVFSGWGGTRENIRS